MPDKTLAGQLGSAGALLALMTQVDDPIIRYVLLIASVILIVLPVVEQTIKDLREHEYEMAAEYEADLIKLENNTSE